MAVSVDTVYQKVLAFANKEQRGYITPQEFNLFADLAQMEIFEQYFYDEDQFERRLGSDVVELLDQKIQVFVESYGAIEHGFILPGDMYKVAIFICMIVKVTEELMLKELTGKISQK